MTATLIEMEGQRCLVVDADASPVRDANDARALIEGAFAERASVIAVPVRRLDDAFFQLRTGLAGEVLQKMVNYGLKLAVIGDVSSFVAASDAFRDLVIESNGTHSSIYFVADVAELTRRLTAGG